MADQPEKIPQHRHCVNCGKAFAGDGQFCDVECSSLAGMAAKKKIKKLGIIWLAIVAVTIVAVTIYYTASG